jgi:hypothetical protein
VGGRRGLTEGLWEKRGKERGKGKVACMSMSVGTKEMMEGKTGSNDVEKMD